MAEEPRRNSSGLQGKFETLHEFVKAARLKLSPTTWDYVVGAAETETTLKRNRYAIDSVAFRPRVLNDITGGDCSGTVMGKKARLPVMLAPVGGLERLDPDGAAAVARGATLFGIPQMLSSVSDPGLEATAKAANGRKFFQLYRRGPDSGPTRSSTARSTLVTRPSATRSTARSMEGASAISRGAFPIARS